MTTGTYSFVSLVVKIILLEFTLLFLIPSKGQIQYFVHVRFNSTLQLINGISSDCQKLLKYFNETAVVASFFRTEFLLSIALALYLKNLKALRFAILALKLVA